jgi:hypothetical protein
MKTTAHVLHTAAAIGALALTSAAVAIPISSTGVTWSNAVGGSNLAYNQVNGNYTDVRWGVSTGEGQSGLGFNPANPPTIDYPANTPFLLGHLRHYNNPIAGGSASSSVDLALGAFIDGASPASQTFAFRFLIDETPNVSPCAYPSPSEPCADRIQFQNLDLTSAFVFGGASYTLELLGFRASFESPLLSYFDSQEGGTNKIGLYGRFVAAPVRVPEPGTLGLISFGLLLTGFAVRRKTC